MNVVKFPDRSLLGAQKNLAKLINEARRLNAFGPKVDFDAPIWDISHIVDRRPGLNGKTHRLYFTRRDVSSLNSKTLEGRSLLTPPFSDFVKAMIATHHVASPKSPSSYVAILLAARFLHEALPRSGHNVGEAVLSDFFATIADIKACLKGEGVYRMAAALEQIASFIDKKELSKVPIRFSNPVKKMAYADDLVDEEFRAERAKRLPGNDYLNATVNASLAIRENGSDADLARISVLEILCSAPWRINDLLGLHAASVREEQDDSGVMKFGFAHDGSKKAPDQIKWMASQMAPIAKRAYHDILRLSQPARDVALWMESHPGRAWLPETWRLADPDMLITANDIAAAMGFSAPEVSRKWMSERGKKAVIAGSRKLFRIGDLEDAILASMPKIPPGHRWSDYLFIFPRNYFHQKLGPVVPILEFYTQGMLRTFLVGSCDIASIFKRLGILDDSGNPFAVPSNGMRHYLNNLANEGKLSELDLARWSGRKDVTQNVAYDHTGGVPLGRVMRDLMKTDAMRGQVVETVKKLPPADREEFLKARFATAHMTAIGACIQDWSLTPCPSHGACAGCSDHLVIKGDAKHKAETERLLQEHEFMLQQAKAEMDEGTYGASNWVAHNEKMVDGLKKSLAVHEDASVEDGAVVSL